MICHVCCTAIHFLSTFLLLYSGLNCAAVKCMDYTISSKMTSVSLRCDAMSGFVLLLLLLVQLNSSNSTNTCAFPSSEYDALHQIYISLNGPDWTYFSISTDDDSLAGGSPWNFASISNNPCTQQWAFLECYYSGSSCRIEAISMIQVPGLQGELPNVFNAFLNLSTVHISSNTELFGTIPLSITQLSNLTNLNLSSNSLSGTVPSELCKSTHTYIHIS